MKIDIIPVINPIIGKRIARPKIKERANSGSEIIFPNEKINSKIGINDKIPKIKLVIASLLLMYKNKEIFFKKLLKTP